MRFKYVIPIALVMSMLSGCMDRINEVLDLLQGVKQFEFQ
jgi:hypothetical protein